MSKKDLGEKISKVFDAGTGASGLVHLNEEQANKFIDYIVDQSVIMKDAQVVRMSKPTKKVADIDLNDDIFKPGTRGVAVAKTIEATARSQELVSKEIVAMVTIYDDELDDNIEGNAFKDHLMRMIAKKGANQLEKVGLFGKKVTGPLSVDRMFNGFITQAEKGGSPIIDATDTNIFADRFIDRTKVSKLYKSVDSKFRSLINRLYLPSDLILDYEDKYLEGNTRVPTDRLGKLGFTEANALGVPRAVELTGGFATTLTASITAGDTVASVTSATGMTVGDPIAFALGQGEEHITTITAINTLDITVADAFVYPILHTDSNVNTVEEILTDAIDTVVTVKDNMLYGIQKDITLEPSRQPELRATNYILTARIDVLLLNPDLMAVMKGLKSK